MCVNATSSHPLHACQSRIGVKSRNSAETTTTNRQTGVACAYKGIKNEKKGRQEKKSIAKAAPSGGIKNIFNITNKNKGTASNKAYQNVCEIS